MTSSKYSWQEREKSSDYNSKQAIVTSTIVSVYKMHVDNTHIADLNKPTTEISKRPVKIEKSKDISHSHFQNSTYHTTPSYRHKKITFKATQSRCNRNFQITIQKKIRQPSRKLSNWNKLPQGNNLWQTSKWLSNGWKHTRTNLPNKETDDHRKKKMSQAKTSNQPNGLVMKSLKTQCLLNVKPKTFISLSRYNTWWLSLTILFLYFTKTFWFSPSTTFQITSNFNLNHASPLLKLNLSYEQCSSQN